MAAARLCYGCIMAHLLGQPQEERIQHICCCYSSCASPARINRPAVATGLIVFIQLPCFRLAYPGFCKQCEKWNNSYLIKSKVSFCIFHRIFTVSGRRSAHSTPKYSALVLIYWLLELKLPGKNSKYREKLSLSFPYLPKEGSSKKTSLVINSLLGSFSSQVRLTLLTIEEIRSQQENFIKNYHSPISSKDPFFLEVPYTSLSSLHPSSPSLLRWCIYSQVLLPLVFIFSSYIKNLINLPTFHLPVASLFYRPLLGNLEG